VPQTYLFAYDYDKIKTIMQDSKKSDIFILKPVASGTNIYAAQGKGIKLVNKKSVLKKMEHYLLQEYKASPHLIDGLKYDLRIYVLVTSYDPLKVYVFKEGLCRFATEQYNNKKIKQRFSHLTNYAVNKNSAKVGD
jgi:tubulin polyglutamylase TTLL4